MENIVATLASLIMVVYVLYRTFTTLVILPLTEPLLSLGGICFLVLVLIAIGATGLSFTRRKGIAASLAAVVGLLALGSWVRVIFVAPVWMRSNLVWFVIPEVCFCIAGLCKWWIHRQPLESEI
jgi:hypothetical protein